MTRQLLAAQAKRKKAKPSATALQLQAWQRDHEPQAPVTAKALTKVITKSLSRISLFFGAQTVAADSDAVAPHVDISQRSEPGCNPSAVGP